jgi:nanoRNase/pAp phosphatase (c-di-AMP/oligoRNAs hydrolase)
MPEGVVIFEVLSCRHCGKHELSIADDNGVGKRLGGHKCAGAWTIVETFKVSERDLLEAIQENRG